jgi:hypothetical protein
MTPSDEHGIAIPEQGGIWLTHPHAFPSMEGFKCFIDGKERDFTVFKGELDNSPHPAYTHTVG